MPEPELSLDLHVDGSADQSAGDAAPLPFGGTEEGSADPDATSTSAAAQETEKMPEALTATDPVDGEDPALHGATAAGLPDGDEAAAEPEEIGEHAPWAISFSRAAPQAAEAPEGDEADALAKAGDEPRDEDGTADIAGTDMDTPAGPLSGAGADAAAMELAADTGPDDAEATASGEADGAMFRSARPGPAALAETDLPQDALAGDPASIQAGPAGSPWARQAIRCGRANCASTAFAGSQTPILAATSAKERMVSRSTSSGATPSSTAAAASSAGAIQRQAG
ncbi:hypothetical protein [Mangrovicoccus ximenensis]|uniref:hypothetical protein n=1 Tax=Mangrovicoccus ximenensis TaxID=1911570 RepID=UPI001F1F1738|nr:hypothetical protein [Mangrovicoccus ximenensis]